MRGRAAQLGPSRAPLSPNPSATALFPRPTRAAQPAAPSPALPEPALPRSLSPTRGSRSPSRTARLRARPGRDWPCAAPGTGSRAQQPCPRAPAVRPLHSASTTQVVPHLLSTALVSPPPSVATVTVVRRGRRRSLRGEVSPSLPFLSPIPLSSSRLS
jgi:hypothetical protein